MSCILIIDDNPDDRDQFSDLLEQAEPGVEVTACYGSRDGLAEAKQRQFDCVLLDLRLDGENGLDVLARLRGVRANLPVIVFTGQGSERAATDAFVAGAAYYLPKRDLTAQTLWTAVARVIQQAETERELKSKREAMERSNRLDAVGQLAAGIAHDFNNQLGTLRFCIELLKDETVAPTSQERVRTAFKILDECANLASRMVSLSRQGDLMAANVCLQDIFADLQAFASVSVSDQVMLDIAEPETGLSAYCDPGQLLNALLNLVLNADGAITAGGKVGTISVTSARDADNVRIGVKDNGIGMSQDVLAKCSDPFFTTKKGQNGTGLGLAIVQGFTNENGGELLIESTVGAGTEVTLVLPTGAAVDELPDAQEQPSPEPTTASGILVVEDQYLLAMMTQEILEKAGHSVEIVRDGEAAIEFLSSGNTVDLLLTDIQMPGMNGFELVDKVRLLSPKTGIIYITGYADNPDHQKRELHGPILQKPIEADELLSTINKVLAGH